MIVPRRRAACTAALMAGVVGGALVATAPAADAAGAGFRPALLRQLTHHASAQAQQGATPSTAQLVTGPVTDSAVVYVVDTGTAEGIRLRHLATGVTEDIIAPVTGAFFADPVLSPDGSQVAYARATLTTPFKVYVASVSATPNPLPVDSASALNQIAPDWSPNGNTVLYSQLDAAGTASALRTVDVSTSPFGTPTTIVTDGKEGRYAVCEPNPGLTCLIPDGSKIAYTIASTGVLATANPNGTGVTPLGVDGEYPSFGPGTDQLVYQYPKGTTGSFGLATVALAADGSAAGTENQIAVTTSAAITAEHPSYSHDGSEIYFARAGYDAANGALTSDLNIASVALFEEQFVADLTFLSTADDFDGHRFGPDIGHGTTSTFTAISPRRILDTRAGAGHVGPCNALGAGGTCEFTVAPLAPDVPAGANAVVLNITGIAPSSATDLRVYPRLGASTPVPTVSNLNLAAGQTAAVAAVVKTGGPAGGPNKVVLRNAAGVTNVAVDIAGYFQTGTTRDRFHALTPTRIADSRSGVGCPTALGAGGVCTLTVTAGGTTALPAQATAVVFNLTGVSGTSATDLRAYPGDAATVPQVSNLNLAARSVRANLVTVALPAANDTIKIRNSAGSTNVIVDIAGYYTSDATDPAGSFFHPVDPVRILDTRSGQKTPTGESLRLGPGGIEQVVTHDTVTTAFGGTELAARATSLVANLTAVAPSTSTDVRAYPADLATPPQISNINVPAGANVPNLLFVTTAPSGTTRGDIKLRNAAGDVSLLFDVFGFFEDN
jgi:hypothetical protein